MKSLKVVVTSLSVACGLFFTIHYAIAKSSLRTVRCDEAKMIEVYIRLNFGTIINFPVKPDNVVLGGQRQFAIEYIKNDIALTALSSNSNTNLFVYLLGRRCGFHLITSSSLQDNLIQVRDPEDLKIKIPFK